MASDLLKPVADQPLETKVSHAWKSKFVDLRAVWCWASSDMQAVVAEIQGNVPQIGSRSRGADANAQAPDEPGMHPRSFLAPARRGAAIRSHNGFAPKSAFLPWLNSKNEAHHRG